MTRSILGDSSGIHCVWKSSYLVQRDYYRLPFQTAPMTIDCWAFTFELQALPRTVTGVIKRYLKVITSVLPFKEIWSIDETLCTWFAAFICLSWYLLSNFVSDYLCKSLKHRFIYWNPKKGKGERRDKFAAFKPSVCRVHDIHDSFCWRRGALLGT